MRLLSFLSLLLTTGVIMIASPVYAQSYEEKEEQVIEQKALYTTNESRTQEENIQAENDMNQVRKDDAEALRKEYKEKAKDAKRISKDANNAFRQSRISVKRERQAQKARIRADRQLIKAQKAAEKSDNNQ